MMNVPMLKSLNCQIKHSSINFFHSVKVHKNYHCKIYENDIPPKCFENPDSPPN